MLNENEPMGLIITQNTYFIVALKSAAAISVLGAVVIAIDPTSAPVVYPVGWIFIFGYTLWRANGLYEVYLKANLPTVARYVGGLGLAGMATCALYFSVTVPLSISMPSLLATVRCGVYANPFHEEFPVYCCSR